MESLLLVVGRMTKTSAEAAEVMRQFATFREGEGLFGHPTAVASAGSMAGHSWFHAYGVGAPDLARIAIRILAQGASSSACERIWSTYGFIHSRLRNRLNAVRAKKLVMVHYNSRMVAKMQAPATQLNYVPWANSPTEEDSDEGASTDGEGDELEGGDVVVGTVEEYLEEVAGDEWVRANEDGESGHDSDSN